MRWPVGIAAGLLIMVLVNGLMIYLAADQPLQIEPSYERVKR